MYKKINKSTALEKLSQSGTVLFDIRDAESYENGHTDKAIHLTNDNLAEIISKTDKSVPVLIMCYSGNSSQAVADYFVQQGFEDVYSINGGYEGWTMEEN